MNIDFHIVNFDKGSGIVHLVCNTPTDEHINLLRRIPKRVYDFSKKLNYIPLISWSKFLDECHKMEFRYDIPPEIEEHIQKALNKADYTVHYDSRRGRLVLRRLNPNVRDLYNSGLTTWMTENWNYTIATSEGYKIPIILIPYNSTVSFDFTDEAKDIIEAETNKRRILLDTINAEDAPEIKDDINLCLRPFQKVAKKFALQTDIRSILALDMGLGKTPVSISIAESREDIKKILVICPAVLKTNWKREIKKSTGLDSINLTGSVPNQQQIMTMLTGNYKYFIINYDILARGTRDDDGHFVSPWSKAIALANFDLIIVDEAHYTKNIDSGRSKAVRELKSKYSILLTGTPIVNRPSELFPLLNIIDPVTFSAYESFSNQWLYNNGKLVRNEKAFREMLSSYMFRRRKEDVIKDLPMIERHDRFIELSSLAKASYQKALEGIYISLKNPEFAKEINSILAQLLRLKQIVADDTVQHTVDLAREIYEESEKKVLIFSQFVATCHSIYSNLEKDGALCITGEDDDESRYAKIDKFQNSDEHKYMILSTKAGAEGLTLTKAHYVIFNDLCWTPKDHRQAEARCYGRMNDLHSATAYYMQAEGTVTEMIMNLLRQKMQIIESTVEGINKDAMEGSSIVGEFLTQLRMGL